MYPASSSLLATLPRMPDMLMVTASARPHLVADWNAALSTPFRLPALTARPGRQW
jgi:hypothetical protein